MVALFSKNFRDSHGVEVNRSSEELNFNDSLRRIKAKHSHRIQEEEEIKNSYITEPVGFETG